MTKFLLLTTHQCRSGRQADLERLRLSVSTAVALGAPIEHYILLQGGAECPGGPLQAHEHALFSPHTMSLSLARNTLLAAATVGETDWLGFPDDDAWYPSDFFAVFEDAIRGCPDVELVLGARSNAPASSSSAPHEGVDGAKVIRLASSNSIFIRGRIARLIGEFDVRLGVGAEFVGGEDSDYALRAFYVAKGALYFPELVVGHDDLRGLPADPWERRRRYLPGVLAFSKKHAGRSTAALTHFLRHLAIGVALLVMGRTSTAHILKPAFAVWRTSRI